MSSPVQRQYADKAAYGPRGEQGKTALSYSIAQAFIRKFGTKK